MSWDRLKEAARNLQRLDPLIHYRCLYKAKVVAQSPTSPDKIDVRPFDSRLPDMAGIPIRHGVPGMHVQVQLGCTVDVGWEDGRPDQPFAALWGPEASVAKLELNGNLIAVGGTSPEFMIKGTTFVAWMGAFLTALGSSDPLAAAACSAAAGGLANLLSKKVTVGG